MPAERRASERSPRRVEVRFWRAGNERPHVGFTTNLSAGGLYLSTTHALVPGERLRVELLDAAAGFVVEAVVVRVHRVSIALRHIEQPGAGVRFLTPPELVSWLLPGARAAKGGMGRERGDSGSVGPPVPGGAGAAPGPVADAESAPVAAGPATPPPAAAVPPDSPPLIVVEFADRTGFLTTYHRDLSAGSLHVSSAVPVGLHERVLIEIRPPLPLAAPLRFEAEVVHRFEPRAAAGDAPRVLPGLGVRFLDAARVRSALAPILAELRR